jgi:hypothetical protein
LPICIIFTAGEPGYQQWENKNLQSAIGNRKSAITITQVGLLG